MWRLLPLLLILCACHTAPPPLTESQVAALPGPALCERAGTAFALNDATGFHLAMTEIGKRTTGFTPAECAALAQIGANKVEANTANRQAMAAAWANGMAQMQKAYEPKPSVSCTSTGNTTNCVQH